ncbi:mycothiol acetyltransferase-like isoform X2 [Pocillopora verrucosa]|uniref:mycothiol acetyltransferase-like isoform X2 n=1 Tax=Pocillopora verrucosa TaxID=203993 RepID=UPI00333F707A
MREDQCRLIFCNLQEKSIPEVRLSSDFVICTWKNGDEHRWIQIGRYASSPLFKEDGFFFIRHNKRYVATAFAWQDKLNSLEGRLHWLAVLPEYHRQGLGRALALRVLLYHKDHGKESVSLITEVYRHSALKLYKDIGFVCSAEET